VEADASTVFGARRAPDRVRGITRKHHEEEFQKMKATRFTPLALIALVGLAACGGGATTAPSAPASTGSTSTEQPSAAASSGTLTVWLMNGSLNDNTVVQLDTDFQVSHPGWKVNYQVQQWDGIADKLTTALASNTPPDVVEMGNTQAITFEAAGALSDLTASRAALGGGTSNDSASDQQLYVASLNSASVYQDKLFALPFYAGDRVLIYRKDLFTAAGIDAASLTSKDKLIAAAKTLNEKNASVKDFSGLYMAGQNWYALLQMIWDRGGQVATNANGTWTASLESPESQAGIQDYVDYYKAGSTGPKDNDEMNPPEYDLFHQGKVGMFIGNGWEIGSAIGTDGKLTKDQVGVTTIPSATDGKTAPVFLGGSVLGIAAKSPNQAAALDWLKGITSDSGQQLLISNGWIPSLKSAAAAIPDTADTAILKVQAAEAAAGSGFTPNDPRWAGVEANNPIKAMLTKILTGAASIADAAKEADQKINTILNAAQ
jgi:N,N'-diacetylchitobiose transport system substrate-binding protein